MLKGINKRMIIIKNPESDIFEEVYFILKSGKNSLKVPKENDMVMEANRILAEYRSQRKNASDVKKSDAEKRIPNAIYEENQMVSDIISENDIKRSLYNFSAKKYYSNPDAFSGEREERHKPTGSYNDDIKSAFKLMSVKKLKNKEIRRTIKGFILGVAAMSVIIIAIRLVQVLVMGV